MNDKDFLNDEFIKRNHEHLIVIAKVYVHMTESNKAIIQNLNDYKHVLKKEQKSHIISKKEQQNKINEINWQIRSLELKSYQHARNRLLQLLGEHYQSLFYTILNNYIEKD